MEYGCKNKVVVISGGTSGIGLAAAEAFWRDGARVFMVGRDPVRGKAALQKLVAGMAGSAGSTGLTVAEAEALSRLRYLRADVTRQEECVTAAEQAAQYGEGHIDILVTSAGIYREKRLEAIAPEDYRQIMDTNVKGTIFMIQACQPYMLPAGEGRTDRCVVTVASDAGIAGNYGCPLYCASKGAVVALTKALALDLAPDIRVNCICPGDVDTPLVDAQLEAAGNSCTKQDLGAGYPLGRIAAAGEVAHVICSVASPRNSFMTGAVIPVDGGLTAIG